MYQGLNVGIVDISINTNTSAADNVNSIDNSAVEAYATFRVLNHEGETVLTKSIPLRPPRAIAGTKRPTTYSGRSGNNKNHIDVENVMCEPHWGPVPVWRMHLFLLVLYGWVSGVMCTGLLLFLAAVILPLLLVWFLVSRMSVRLFPPVAVAAGNGRRDNDRVSVPKKKS